MPNQCEGHSAKEPTGLNLHAYNRINILDFVAVTFLHRAGCLISSNGVSILVPLAALAKGGQLRAPWPCNDSVE